MANVNGKYYNFTIPPFPVGMARDATAIFSETFTPSGATNDTRRLNKVPINITFGAGTFLQVPDVDTGNAIVLTLQVTDGTTTKILIHQSTVGQAGGLARPTKSPSVEDGIGFTTDNNNYWVELLYATQAGTAVSGKFVWGIHTTGWAPTGMKH
jgi:hypothetical protein